MLDEIQLSERRGRELMLAFETESLRKKNRDD
jgi:hypothetical protein